MPHVPYHYTPYKMRTSLICLAWAGRPDTPPATYSRGAVCAPLAVRIRTLSNPSAKSGRRELVPAAACITSEPALASNPAEGRPGNRLLAKVAHSPVLNRRSSFSRSLANVLVSMDFPSSEGAYPPARSRRPCTSSVSYGSSAAGVCNRSKASLSYSFCAGGVIRVPFGTSETSNEPAEQNLASVSTSHLSGVARSCDIQRTGHAS